MTRSSLCLFALALDLSGALAAEPERDRALLTVQGKVVSIRETADSSGATWTDADVVPSGSNEPVRIRIAPPEILEADGFRIAVGDTLEARVFSDEMPFAAQALRNQSTGRALRLRCLHGDPLWTTGEDGRREGRAGKGGGRRRRGGP